MNLYLFDEDNIITFNLPVKKIGNFWMTDNLGNNIVNISSENNSWIISGSETTNIISPTNEEKIVLKEKTYYIVVKNKIKYLLFCDTSDDETFEGFQIADGYSLKVGKNTGNEISMNIPYLQDVDFTLSVDNNKWKIERNPASNVYLNDERIKTNVAYAKSGDTINLYGFRMVLTKGVIFMNHPFSSNVVNKLPKRNFAVKDELTPEEIINKDLYTDSDYFLKSPRMKKVIEKLQIGFDSPPQKEAYQETPLIMTLAPMITMAASSMISLSNAIESITSGTKTWKQSIPTLVICFAMIFSMMIWPFVMKKYEKKQREKREKDRQDKYKNYLNTKNTELSREYEEQRRILSEYLVPTNVCYDTIINKRRTLWERKPDQDDFLKIRVGTGQVPFDANINYHTEDFKMDDDNLKDMLNNLVKNYEVLKDVPIGYSLSENKLTAINGTDPEKFRTFTNNILLQLMSFHSYDDLKIVIFTNKINSKKWDYIKDSPYCFSNDKQIRFFATNTEEMQEISNYLTQLFNNRKVLSNNGSADEKISDFSKFNGYYLVIVDDINRARKIDIIDNILEEKKNLGFSLVIMEEKLSKIPSQVSKFITIGDSTSVILSSENNNQVKFNDEISDEFDMYSVTKTLSNLPIYFDTNVKQMPNSITFLELFSVGQIEQLNVLNRWKDNNPVKTLKTEIGVNENNDLFILDLHEKQHGPHGLVAGMTGSGKSEFIITYVLSMAINYSPEEVAFVLIDYKGGGLAGAFVNSETGEKLPHVVGTITNLDKAEINRALSSIQSELRRRQTKFNEVRDKLGESTIDIYKYQKLYRDGVINEPIPHLIIVCDEFAELKDQQPDFMDDLISTARIGRSLGVHLILATQKPSGVVDAQIWSNSKFKICLKVQDKSDSMEMIKNDLAAELKNVGRFYLQVGYNEYFAMGQAAWAGAQYYPNKEFKKAIDKNIYFIDNIGNVSKSINNTTIKKVKSQGEELTNVVKYLINIASNTSLNIRQLWLDRIPNIILLNDLYKKYNYAKEKFIINPIIGEYDDPSNQMQGLLTLPITKEGNTVLYGMNDSGKDEFLSSLVYSMISTYDTSELNLYLMDFGAETLQNYSDAPQVGNVILNGDDEKLENLAKMLNSEMNKRKKLFMSYNGNYEDYLKLSGRSLPNIVVLINSIEVLTEVYQDYIDKLVPVIREGSKYGINFVITTANQNSIRFKVAQCCKQVICLQMNNETDYRDILGKTNGLVPFACLGRGLIKLDRVVEFQTVSICDGDSSFNAIKELIGKLNEKGINKAKEIPVMPETIEISRFGDKYKDLTTVPIGLNKETLVAHLYDYTKNVCNIVSSNEFENMREFILNFIKVIEQNNDTFGRVVVDACNFFEEFNYNINLMDNDFGRVIDELKQIDDNLQSTLANNNMNLRSIKDVKNYMVVIIGFNKFFDKLDDEHKQMFIDILANEKETLKINFVLFDVPNSFKKYEYEDWYKNSFNTNDGLWIGSGVTQQFLLKTTIQPSGISNIENDHAVAIKNGMPVIIKIINEIKK